MGGVVIIPARGGSKRIPRKNLERLNGKTMLERVISTAHSISGISAVVVSTDDPEIAEYSKAHGAQINGLRPAHLANDESPTAPVIVYELSELSNLMEGLEFVVVMYPTSVFIKGSQIDLMVRKYQSDIATVDMVMTVAEYPAPIERSWILREGGIGEELFPGNRNKQSQEFQKCFYDVGQTYVSSMSAWSDLNKGMPVRTSLFLIDDPVVDINSPTDLKLADAIIRSVEMPLDARSGEFSQNG